MKTFTIRATLQTRLLNIDSNLHISEVDEKSGWLQVREGLQSLGFILHHDGTPESIEALIPHVAK